MTHDKDAATDRWVGIPWSYVEAFKEAVRAARGPDHA